MDLQDLTQMIPARMSGSGASLPAAIAHGFKSAGMDIFGYVIMSGSFRRVALAGSLHMASAAFSMRNTDPPPSEGQESTAELGRLRPFASYNGANMRLLRAHDTILAGALVVVEHLFQAVSNCCESRNLISTELFDIRNCSEPPFPRRVCARRRK